MKIIISLTLILLSFCLAYISASSCRRNVTESESLLRFSKEIKSNLEGQMLPLHIVASRMLLGIDRKNIFFSSPDELFMYIKENYSSLPYLSDFLDDLSCIPHSGKDELIKHSKILA